MSVYDVIVLGAGAAGLMCAGVAAQRGRRVLVLDHASKPAEKIRISGGGRCNFTNIHTHPSCFLSENPHFATSALKRFTPADFLAYVYRHRIPYHEKTLGQLFCDRSAQDIITLLLDELKAGQGELRLQTSLEDVRHTGDKFILKTSTGTYETTSLVVATGGKSIPKMGATGLGYTLAENFGMTLTPLRAGLVPLTFAPEFLAATTPLAGVAVETATVHSQQGKSFQEALLFTHRGLSGPSILQISSYWQQGEWISINWSPQENLLSFFQKMRTQSPRTLLPSVVADILPKRLAAKLCEMNPDVFPAVRLADLSNKALEKAANLLHHWKVFPNGTEGYRTAEVTLGGVCVEEVSSKTFESKKVQGLYFIGEVLDVTGHLGGYNFQWAWSSGWCAGQYV